MATRLSDSFRKTALTLVNRFGKDYIIRREVTGPKDPTRPTAPGPTTIEDYTCKAAVTSFETEQIDGIQVLRGDLKVVVAHTSILPEEILPGDFFIEVLRINNETDFFEEPFFDREDWWGVVSRFKKYNIIPPVKTITVNGIVVAYILQVRR